MDSNLSYILKLFQVFKIYGAGPKQISDSMMEQYYKYNSGIFFVQLLMRHVDMQLSRNSRRILSLLVIFYVSTQ